MLPMARPRRTDQQLGVEDTAKLSLYVPRQKGGATVLNRLRKIAERDDRSLNYLAVQAILEFLDRKEQRS